MTTLELYRKHKSGDISREKFLYEVRRDNNLPYITNLTSYTDAVQILKNKGIVTEETKEAKADEAVKAEVKPKKSTEPKLKELHIDYANPYEYRHGLAHELDAIGEYTDEALEKAKTTVLKNLAKDANFYSSLLNQDQSPYKFKAPETDAPGMQAKADGYLKKETKKDEKANVKDNLGKKEEGTTKPKGVKVMPDKGVTGSEKTIKEGLEITKAPAPYDNQIEISDDGGEYSGFIEDNGTVSFSVYYDDMEDIENKFGPEGISEDNWKDVLGSNHAFVKIINNIGGDVEAAGDSVEITVNTDKLLNSNLKEGDGVASNKVDDMIKSGKIKPEEVKAAAEKAMKGDSTSLIALMAGLPGISLSEDTVEEGKANKYISVEIEGNEQFPMLNKVLVSDYLKSVIDPEEIESVDAFMDDEEGFDESSSYFFDNDEENTSEKDVEDWAKQEMSYYLFSKPDEFPGKGDIMEAKIEENKIGSLLNAVVDEWGEDSDFYSELQDSLAGWADRNGQLTPKGKIAVKALLSNWDVLDDYGHLLDDDNDDMNEADASDDLNPNELSDENTFEDLMKKYDWYYEMSDDPREYDRGTAMDKQLQSLAKSIGIDRAVELFNKYAPSDRKETTSFFQMREDKHSKLKELLKKGLKELINPKDIQTAKSTGDVVNIPVQDSAAQTAAKNAKINFRTYKS